MTRKSRHRLIVLLFASAFATLMCLSRDANVDAVVSDNGFSVRGELSQQEKPVEQVRKNIQVLKGLPAPQIYPVMWFIRDSLGVQCDYCHVKQGPDLDKGWSWESDDKPQKVRAREMMRMVLDINKNSFGGNQAVTCYSCHRGTTRPERLVALPTFEAFVTRPDAKPAVPTAEQILDRYIKSVGGQDAAAKVKSIVYTGNIQRSEGRNSAVEITTKGADKYLSKLTTPQGTVVQGIDVGAVWVKDNNGPRPLADADLEQLRQRIALYGVIKIAEQPAQMRVLGLEKMGDKDAYVIDVTSGPKTIKKYFFDAQTGLLLRITTIRQAILLPLPEQTEFEDYRDVGGVKLPFTMRTSDVDAFSAATRKFTDVRLNVAVDDSVFKMPPK